MSGSGSSTPSGCLPYRASRTGFAWTAVPRCDLRLLSANPPGCWYGLALRICLPGVCHCRITRHLPQQSQKAIIEEEDDPLHAQGSITTFIESGAIDF